jgi:hypothetical protein
MQAQDLSAMKVRQERSDFMNFSTQPNSGFKSFEPSVMKSDRKAFYSSEKRNRVVIEANLFNRNEKLE